MTSRTHFYPQPRSVLSRCYHLGLLSQCRGPHRHSAGAKRHSLRKGVHHAAPSPLACTSSPRRHPARRRTWTRSVCPTGHFLALAVPRRLADRPVGPGPVPRTPFLRARRKHSSSRRRNSLAARRHSRPIERPDLHAPGRRLSGNGSRRLGSQHSEDQVAPNVVSDDLGSLSGASFHLVMSTNFPRRALL